VRHGRAAIRGACIATAVLVVVALAGCSSSSSKAPLDRVSAAKKTTLAVESQIAAYVPASDVISTHQTETSKVIFPCLGKPGTSYWPGTTVVNVKPGSDTASVMSAIAAHWTNASGWSVFQSKDSSGNPTLIIKSTAAASFTVSVVQGPQLSIVALSSCFSNDGLTGLTSY
jgi:hypothetical protein